MFRKAAIVLALAASFLGAQAMDMPKPVRDLTSKNKTKAAGKTNGAKAKAKTVQVCLEGVDGRLATIADDVANTLLFTAGMNAFSCANFGSDGMLIGTPEPIGGIGITCSGPDGGLYLQCVAQISLDTTWHKTTQTSSLSGTFWMDPAVYVAPATSGLVTMINPVVTGTTGAWGKADNIKTVALAPLAGSSNTNYKLTIGYKGRGWNPAAY